ncbi:Rap1a/Tai family immunity protein [Bradyrhizobium sp. DASA03007]|uniref:Rap1a/Tai family immunity protein n=1 Tax=unclassified Bradyrhizobium TaxID=2631580 RepID=UPI003F6FA89E
MPGAALALACAGNVPGLKKDRKADDYAKFCNAYINGWDDARIAFMQGTRTFCPTGLPVKEMSVIFFDYMMAHKEARDVPAADALMLAFKDKFPCEDTSDSKQAAAKVKVSDLPSEVSRIANDVAAECKGADVDNTGGDLDKTISVYERGDGKRLAIFDPNKICTFKGNGACSTGGCDFYVYSEQPDGSPWKKELDQTVFDKRVVEGKSGQAPLKIFVEMRSDVSPCNRKHGAPSCFFELTWRNTGFVWNQVKSIPR